MRINWPDLLFLSLIKIIIKLYKILKKHINSHFLRTYWVLLSFSKEDIEEILSSDGSCRWQTSVEALQALCFTQPVSDRCSEIKHFSASIRFLLWSQCEAPNNPLWNVLCNRCKYSICNLALYLCILQLLFKNLKLPKTGRTTIFFVVAHIFSKDWESKFCQALRGLTFWMFCVSTTKSFTT